MKPANNNIRNEMPIAGVKGATAKNMLIKERIMANPIIAFIIGVSKSNNTLRKNQLFRT